MSEMEAAALAERCRRWWCLRVRGAGGVKGGGGVRGCSSSEEEYEYESRERLCLPTASGVSALNSLVEFARRRGAERDIARLTRSATLICAGFS